MATQSNDPFAEFVAAPAPVQSAQADADPFAEFAQQPSAIPERTVGTPQHSQWLAEQQAAPPAGQDPATASVFGNTAIAERPKKLALPQRKDSPVRETVRSLLRGGTLGLSDVLGAGVAAGIAKAGGADFTDAYRDIKADISQSRDVFREENPALAYGGEIAGAVIPTVLSGGMTGTAQGTGLVANLAKTGVKAGEAIKAVPYLGRAAQLGGQGAAMGGIYGATQAEEGKALEGAATGAATGAIGQAGMMKLMERFIPAGAVQESLKQVVNKEMADKGGDIIANIQVQLQKDGIDFNALSPVAKKSITDFATLASAVNADDMTMKAVGRKAVLESLPEPVQATRGTLTGDYIQQQKEGLIADTSNILGRDLAERLRSYQPALVSNLEKIKGQTGGTADDLYKAGQSLRSVVEKRAAKSKQEVSSAYKVAEEVAGDQPAQFGDNVISWLNENAGFNGVPALQQKAKALGILKEETLEDGTKALVPQETTFKKLNELRKAATALQTSSDGTTKTMGGQFKQIIDDVYETQGGDLYKDAARLRRQHALQYESGPKVVRDILKLRAGSETDKAIANEDLFTATIQRGSAEDVKKLFGYLTKDKEFRQEGVQQIKDLRSMAIEQLKQQASSGQAGFTSAQWNKALKNLGGREKLQTLFGKEGYNELQNFTKAADILLNKEKSVAGGSQTASRVAMMAESLFDNLGKIPVIGSSAEAAGRVLKVGATSLGAKNALLDPTQDIAGEVIKKAKENAMISPAATALKKAAIVSAASPDASRR